MPDKRISEMTAVSSLSGDELIEVVQDGQNKRALISQIPGGGGGGGSQLSFDVVELSISSGSVTVPVSSGGVMNCLFKLAMTGNVTSWVYTGTPGAGKGWSIMIEVTQGDPPRSLTLNEGSSWTDSSLTDLDSDIGAKYLLAMTSHDNFATVGATMGKLQGVEPPAPDLIYLELNNIDELDPNQFLTPNGDAGVLELNL